MTKELQDLFEELDSYRKENGITDYSISEPNEDDEHDYICCDQNIIHYVNGSYDISCLYNMTPSYKFKTKEEVIYFLLGYWSGSVAFEDPNDDINVAYNLGLYSAAMPLMTHFFKLNKEKYLNCLNDKQYDWAERQHAELNLEKLPDWFYL
jgi:hypothetical protein